jgi:hypothetical protein
MEQPPPSGAVVEAIIHRLLRGGATAIDLTTPPLWIVGNAPSGRQFQIEWEPGEQAYHVRRWPAENADDEPLGTFPEWEAAVACALQA